MNPKIGEVNRPWSSDVEPKQHHVAVANDVVLALGPHDALLARPFPTVVGHEFVVADRLGADESALEADRDSTQALPLVCRIAARRPKCRYQ